MHTIFALWFKARETYQSLQRSSDAEDQHEAETYLAGAVTLADLESRERSWLQTH